MLRKVLKHIKDSSLLEPGERVVVGVSGGADSVALLDVLLRGGWRCVVCHCNFHLRGAESERDEQFVRGLVETMQRRIDAEGFLSEVTLRVKHFDTAQLAKTNGRGIEEEARAERYAWFAEEASSMGLRSVCVAHNLGDQAETVVMHVLRGCGLRGLCGMENVSQLLGSDIRLVRPLLNIERSEIEHYLRVRGQEWVEDSSNSSLAYKRNVVRRVLRLLGRGEVRNIARLSERVRGYIGERESLSVAAVAENVKREVML